MLYRGIQLPAVRGDKKLKCFNRTSGHLAIKVGLQNMIMNMYNWKCHQYRVFNYFLLAPAPLFSLFHACHAVPSLLPSPPSSLHPSLSSGSFIWFFGPSTSASLTGLAAKPAGLDTLPTASSPGKTSLLQLCQTSSP